MDRRLAGTLLVLGLLLPAGAKGTDRPVRGYRLALRASDAATPRLEARMILRDSSIAAPFPNPELGAALIVSGGAEAGQCRVDVRLPVSGWRAVGGDGEHLGYSYRDRWGRNGGVRWILIRPGLISIRAGGRHWPCDLSAASQRLPLAVVLRVGNDRYCSDFGGTVTLNVPRRFQARHAPAPPACPPADLTAVNLNLLHGAFCPPQSEDCRLADRIDLLFQWIAASGCPDIATLQEVSTRAVPLLAAHLESTCPFHYQYVFEETNVLDNEMIITRYPAVSHEVRQLFGGLRTVLFARLDHPLGPVDVFTTHLAAGVDGGPRPCGSSCPPECVAAGAATVRSCQAAQTAEFVTLHHDVAPAALLTGDFNDKPGTPVYQQFAGRGWTDAYLAGGNPECTPATGRGCTSGREDEDLSELESPASNADERIDYIFLIPPAAGSSCVARIDSREDEDGDGTATRIFADDPNPFSATCGPLPAPICWPSDHEGVQVDVNCD